MSREFGSYGGTGYFDSKIESVADDLAKGSCELTRLWGKWFEEFYDIAYAIANCEAGDSGAYDPILTTIKKLSALKQTMAAIEEYLRVFEDVMEEVVREKAREDSKC